MPPSTSPRSLPTRPAAAWQLDLDSAAARLTLRPDGPALDLLVDDVIVAEVRFAADQPLGDPDLATAVETRTSDDGQRLWLQSPFGELAVTLAPGPAGTVRLDLWSETAKPTAWRLRLQSHHPLTARACRYEQPDTLWLDAAPDAPWTAALRLLTDAVPAEHAADDFGVALRYPRARQFVLSISLGAATGKAAARAVAKALDTAFTSA